MDLLEAMRRRASTRAFLDRPVARQTVEAVLDAARWAPSGVNIQPWHVAVVTGDTKERLTRSIIDTCEAKKAGNPDYDYYPQEWMEPYISRRKQCGIALYRSLGIDRDDARGRKEAWYNNYRFFGAPVGLLFFLEKGLGQGAWIDMGMFLQNVMLAAETFELSTCPQASLAEYPGIVRNVLDLPSNLALVCGMALGYADPDAPVNQYRTEREPVEAFTRWYP